MRKLCHYPKNGLDRKTSNEVITDDQALHEHYSGAALPHHLIHKKHNTGQQLQKDMQ